MLLQISTVTPLRLNYSAWNFLGHPTCSNSIEVTYLILYRYTPFHPSCKLKLCWLTQHPTKLNMCRFSVDLGVYKMSEDSRSEATDKGRDVVTWWFLLEATNLFTWQSLLHDNKTSLILYTLHANAACAGLTSWCTSKSQQSMKLGSRKNLTRDSQFSAHAQIMTYRICFFRWGRGSFKISWTGHTALAFGERQALS